MVAIAKWFRHRWVLILTGWTVFGVWMTAQQYLVATRLGRPWEGARAFFVEMVYAYGWAVLTPLILRLSRRLRFARTTWPRTLALHFAAGAAIALVHRAAFIIITGWYGALFTGPPFSWQTVSRQIFTYLDYGILLYGMILILDHAWAYYLDLRTKELRASQLEAQLAQAQLQALKMQLQPHFLFNTLNAISVLIPRDPELAQQTLRQLSELLRLTLENAGTHLVPLRVELDFLERYLQIEQTRFGDRLTVALQIAPDTLEAQVPTLLLQPLVENAIRHGVSALRGPARLEISAQHHNGHLRLQVRDNGRGLAHQHRNGEVRGIGLSNTRARLAQLYGSDFRLDLTAAEGGGVTASVEIPLILAPPS